MKKGFALLSSLISIAILAFGMTTVNLSFAAEDSDETMGYHFFVGTLSDSGGVNTSVYINGLEESYDQYYYELYEQVVTRQSNGKIILTENLVQKMPLSESYQKDKFKGTSMEAIIPLLGFDGEAKVDSKLKLVHGTYYIGKLYHAKTNELLVKSELIVPAGFLTTSTVTQKSEIDVRFQLAYGAELEYTDYKIQPLFDISEEAESNILIGKVADNKVQVKLPLAAQKNYYSIMLKKSFAKYYRSGSLMSLMKLAPVAAGQTTTPVVTTPTTPKVTPPVVTAPPVTTPPVTTSKTTTAPTTTPLTTAPTTTVKETPSVTNKPSLNGVALGTSSLKCTYIFPQNNATDVTLKFDYMVMQFNRNIRAVQSPSEILLVDESGKRVAISQAVPGITDKTALILVPESKLLKNTKYTLTIPSKVIQAEDNGEYFDGSVHLSFTMGANGAGPGVNYLRSFPANQDKAAVIKWGYIELVFDKAIREVADPSKIQLTDGNGNRLTVTYAKPGTTVKTSLIIDPIQNFDPNQTYTLVIPANTVESAAGGEFYANEIRITFTMSR